MGSIGFVIPLPDCCDVACLTKGTELVCAQKLFAIGEVEAFNVSVPRWIAGLELK